ncbi:MAG: hypothetical protein ACI8P3_000776, partial [Saprospiraceae bacterium]
PQRKLIISTYTEGASRDRRKGNIGYWRSSLRKGSKKIKRYKHKPT